MFRLSGTGTEGATLRLYLERYAAGAGRAGSSTRRQRLAPVIRAAHAVAGIEAHTGRETPDVVT